MRLNEETGKYEGPASERELVKVALQIAEAGMNGKLEELTSPEATKVFLKLKLASHPYEVFSCLFLDNRHQVIVFDEIFRGTINGASVYPREVVRECMKHNAAAVVFAHNHPSGMAEPSQADIRITQRLTEALRLIDVRVLDHIIIGEGEPFSFAEGGLI